MNLFSSFQRIYSTAVDPSTSEELLWTKKELLSVLEPISLDLGVLEASVDVAERDPIKFNLTQEEAAERRAVVGKIRKEVEQIRELVRNPKMKRAKATGAESRSSKGADKVRSNHDALPSRNQVSALPYRQVAASPYRQVAASAYREVVSENVQEATDSETGRQQMLFREQDTQLDHISGALINMKSMASTIGTEVEDQTKCFCFCFFVLF